MKNFSAVQASSKLYLFFIILAFCASACKTERKELENTAELPLFAQDTSLLKDFNGAIFEKEQIQFETGYSDEVESYRIKYSSDGLKVVGFLVKPKKEGARWPVLIFNRGGNREFGKITLMMMKYFSFLASNGYVILASQYRGNDGGEGKEEFGGSDVNDVLNLIPLAKSLPFTEPDKIVMLGYSRGGMMTYLAIKKGAQIRAAAVVSGVTDLIQMLEEREPGMRKVVEELVGKDESEYRKRSALYWPDEINVPVLILHGGEDLRVNADQAEKLAEELKKLGKEHELAVFPGGDHGLSTHRPERNRLIFEWFDKYLR